MAKKEQAAAEPTAAEDAGQLVELADKDTGFWDPKTGFQLVRDQRVRLGPKVGDATNVALAAGRLLVVK